MLQRATNTSEVVPANKSRRTLLLAIKACVTIALLYWLINKIDVAQIGPLLARLPPGYVAAAIAIHIMVFVLGAIRWWILLRPAGVHLPLLHVLPSYFLGVLFNNLLPTSVGGDVVRVLHLKLAGSNGQALISSTLIDRAVGLAALISMATAAVLLAADSDGLAVLSTSLLAVASIIVAILLLLFAPFTTRLVDSLIRRFEHTHVRRWLLGTIRLCQGFAGAWRSMSLAFLLSLLLQSTLIFAYALLATGLHINLPLAAFFAVIPLVFVAASLPISVGGLGVREAALVSLLSMQGVEAQSAVALSIVYLLVLLVASLPGLAVLLRPRKELSFTATKS